MELCKKCKEFDQVMNGGPASLDVFVACDHIQPERSKREDLTSCSPLPDGLAERLWKMGDC
jgi:hypothetical protein